MILDILKELASTSKVTEKQVILEKHKDNAVLKEVLWYALSPAITYYVKKLNDYHPNYTSACGLLSESLANLTQLTERKVTGHDALDWVQTQMESLNNDDATVFSRVVLKDLRCGVGAKLVNKVFPGLIYVHPYNRSSSFTDKNVANLTYPCYGQLKADGLYIDTVVTPDKVEHISRNGNVINLFGLFDKLNEQVVDKGFVLQGEGVILNEFGDGYLPRKKSNGIFNSDRLADYKDRIRLLVWDFISIEDFYSRKTPVEYKARFPAAARIAQHHSQIELIQSQVLNNEEEAYAMYSKLLADGEEGIIAKNLDHKWKDGTSKDSVKFKANKEADLMVVNWKPGALGKKTEHGIGSLLCQTRDGLLEVGVSGLSDEQRGIVGTRVGDGIVYGPIPGFDRDQYNGKIMTTIYNEIIDHQDDDNLKSLFLPRAKKNADDGIEFRTDKTEADSLAELLGKVKGG